MSDGTEPTEPEAAASVGEQSPTEADFLARLKAANEAVRTVSRMEPSIPGYEQWWLQLAEARDAVAQVYQDASVSRLWSIESFAWEAINTAHWFERKGAEKARHEAGIVADHARSGSGGAS